MENKTDNACKTGLKKRFTKNAFCLPKGIAGRFGGQLMAIDRVLPAWILGLLEIKSSDAILEIGCGPGVGVELAAAIVEKRIVGVDPSETMLGMARKRNRKAIEAGKVEFLKGTANHLPFNSASFDAAFTINSLHLWSNPVRGLREVKRTLRKGGRIAIGISRFSHASPDKFGDYLIEAGFGDIHAHTHERGTCVTGKSLE